MITTPRTVYGYVRGSTEEQRNTIEAQRNAITSYCAATGDTLAGIYIDSGVSGKTPFTERPAVIDMRRDMEANHVTHIVFTKLDRAFRSTIDCITTLDDWRKAGIGFTILDLQIDTSNAIGMAIMRILAVLAEFELEQRRERQATALGVMRQQGQRCGTIPYGWTAIKSTRISKTKRQADDLVPCHEEQDTLARILQWHRDGTSDNEIARRLNARGIPAKRGGRWHGATVQSVREHARLAPSLSHLVAA